MQYKHRRVNSLQETIARQTIELTFEPFFHWTKNFKTSKISKFLKLRPNAIEHLIIPSTEGQIVWSIASTPIK
jgi:hypothetical protein